MQEQDRAKWAAAQGALQFVKDGMTVGLGTGSTAEKFVRLLAQKAADEHWQLSCVSTSKAIAALAQELGLTGEFTNPSLLHVDMTFDGADETDKAGNLVKGGGGALLREKLVALASDEVTIMVDESKHVEVLGRAFKLPVEIVPFGYQRTVKRLEALGAKAVLRCRQDQLFVTDNGNYIADCDFGGIANPAELAVQLKSITGVVESGIFAGIAKRIVTGRSDGTWTVQEL
ncbi:MAG: ribose-5-phosphate isomerase RpiA [bacterium]|nr:ribose-5-phosphate isomerase RpiA [bacterium]